MPLDEDQIRNVIPVGAKVSIGPDRSIDAVVVCISIAKTRVLYQVAYWVGAERKEVWIEEFEISAPQERMRFGFHANGFCGLGN